MTGIDANILLYAYVDQAPEHPLAHAFLTENADNSAFVVSEFTLTEFYLLLRNPAVLRNPLRSGKACAVIESYRQHPAWKIVGFSPHGRDLHDRLWHLANRPQFARRRIYDLRTALTLQAFGVTEFATANLKDFQGMGFNRVWNPVDKTAKRGA